MPLRTDSAGGSRVLQSRLEADFLVCPGLGDVERASDLTLLPEALDTQIPPNSQLRWNLQRLNFTLRLLSDFPFCFSSKGYV